MKSDQHTKTLPPVGSGNTSGAQNGANKPRFRRRHPKDKDPQELGFLNLMFLLLFPLTFIYLELVLHISRFGTLTGSFFAYSVLFALPAGLLCALLCSIGPAKVNYWITAGILGFFTVYFGVQMVYHTFFGDFFYWDLLSVGGDILQFAGNIMLTIWSCAIPLLLLFLPLILFLIFGRKLLRPIPMNWGLRIVATVLTVGFFLGGLGFVNGHTDMMGDRYLYNDGFQMTDATARFGLLTSLRLDTRYKLFGHSEGDEPELTRGEITTNNWQEIFGTSTGTPAGTTSPDQTRGGDPVTGTAEPAVTTEPPKPVDTSPQVMNIDFEPLINKAATTAEKNAHIWFSGREPTKKNAYTGLFKDKNLIMITVESWAPAAINQTFTPTLWKMKNEGFVFDNYYCSMWGGSTATGEYAVITGNFYNSAECLRMSAKTKEVFTLGKSLGKLGYNCLAFHDWTYEYYGRDQSHPNFGYQYYGTIYSTKGNYKGANGWVDANGKQVEFTRAWPLSDLELANNSAHYIPSDGSKFHIYYMSVSGHPLQTFSGNAQARNHRQDVLAANLPYTDQNALSFIASQYEVELMVNRLIDELKAKGQYENTVFVMAPDHYPYNITADEQLIKDDAANVQALSQLYNLPADNSIFLNPELYKAPLIIWTPDMKPEHVTKVCSAPDILPTVLNLFGCEYDSRLIMGHDIFSDSEGFAILNMSNRQGTASSYNWVTDYGFYNNSKKTFTLAPGVTVDPKALEASGYITAHSTLVSEMYKYSKYILDNNYYKKVFPNG